jgi:hypothetical protein
MVVLALNPSLAVGDSLKGKVKKKVYHSPAKNFTVRVPPRGIYGKPKIYDHYGKELGVGGVSFADDAGNLQAILYMTMPDHMVSPFQNGGANALKDWFHKAAMPAWFLPVSPNSRVLEEVASSFKGTDAYIALVEIPQGSPAMDLKTGKRFDSTRGLIMFVRGHSVYILATETYGPQLQIWNPPVKDPPVKDENWLGFTERLESFYETIKFID